MNALEKQKQFEQELSATLLDALEQEIVGEASTPALVGRVKTCIRGILYAKSVSGAKVSVTSIPNGISVQIRLPPKGPRVGIIKLSIGT